MSRTSLFHSPRLHSPSKGQWGVVALSAIAGATAVWVEGRSRRAERDNKPAGKFIYIDGVRLHYVMRGAGKPVVLLHGNTVTFADFEASGLFDRLARDHCVIAFDRPGFGHSSRPRDRLWTPEAQAALLRRALIGLGIGKPAVLVAHSMGTLVALAMALESPASVEGLVLIGGYYYPTLRADALLMAPVALPVLGDVLRYTVTALSARASLGHLVKGMFAPQEVAPGFFNSLSREMMLRPLQIRANAEDAAFMMPQARSLAQRYGQLRMPVTIVAGAQDKVVDMQAHARRLHQQLPHSQLVVVPHAGHMAHYRAQDQIVAAVGQASDALARQAPSPASPDEPASAAPEGLVRKT